MATNHPRARLSEPPQSQRTTPATRSRLPVRLAAVAVASIAVLAAGCGSSVPEAGATDVGGTTGASGTASVIDSRAGQGITAAGGTITEAEPCSSGTGDRHTIASLAPDLDRFDTIGLETLVFDYPQNVIGAYLNNVNRLGVGDGCFELKSYVWGFTDSVGDFERMCADLPNHDPVALIVFVVTPEVLECATIGLGIPTIALYSQLPGGLVAAAGGRLLLDHGSTEYLLENSLLAAAGAGVLTEDDTVSLLYEDYLFAQPEIDAFERITRRLNLTTAGAVGVPEALAATPVRVIQNQLLDLGVDVLSAETAALEAALATLPPEFGRLMLGIREFYLNAASQLADTGVTAVAVSAGWEDVSNLMVAAELIGWHPKWITNDGQYAMTVLTGTPSEQGRNFYQLSSRRAADDPIAGLDRGCLSLRNTETDADLFEHRHHTDAWSALTETCDYLDLLFAAITRVSGPLTAESLSPALADASYEAPHGTLISFSPDDFYGSDSFRITVPDLDCLLNDWGCMRSITEWFPATTAASAAAQ